MGFSISQRCSRSWKNHFDSFFTHCTTLLRDGGGKLAVSVWLIPSQGSFGKPRANCAIQRARARMGLLQGTGGNPEGRSILLAQVDAMLVQAKHNLDKADRYYIKDLENYERLVKWVAVERNRGRLIDPETRTYIG